MSRDVLADLLKNETLLQMGAFTVSFASVLPWIPRVRAVGSTRLTHDVLQFSPFCNTTCA